jgi:hypothetical protein
MRVIVGRPDMAPLNLPQTVVIDGLRRWCRGAYAEEAAVELLVRAFGGRFAGLEWPWVRLCDQPGWFWLDGEPLIRDTGALSGGERRLLAVTGALVSGVALGDLGSVLAGLDRSLLHLVLAGFAHAGGSHEQCESWIDGDRLLYRRLGPLVDWPAESARVA